MQLLTLLPVLSVLSPFLFLLLLLPSSLAAPSDVTKTEQDVPGGGMDAERDLVKRYSNFVRIGRPSNFVRIGRGSRFVRIGRPGNFVRIGRSYNGNLDPSTFDQEEEKYGADKRASRFVRIGKQPSRFVRIGKSAQMEPEVKRMSSFVRIGKSDPYADLDTDDVSKRFSSFVRIGRFPQSAFVRIGRSPGEGEEDLSNFDRVARMGHSSFVRIGKRSVHLGQLLKQGEEVSQ